MLVSRKVVRNLRKSAVQTTKTREFVRVAWREGGARGNASVVEDRGKAGGFEARSPRSRSGRLASGIQTLAAGKDLKCPSSGIVLLFLLFSLRKFNQFSSGL